MKTIADIGANRLKRVLYEDKKKSPEKISMLIKSDISSFLENFMEVNKESLIVQIKPLANGTYNVNINLNAENLKMFNLISQYN